MTYERDRDDAIFERERTGLGTIVAIVLAIAVVLAIIWILFLGGLGTITNTNAVPGNDTTPQTQANSDPNTNIRP